MDKQIWFSVLPSLITITIAIWSKRIIPSLLVGLILGGYFLNPTIIGGIDTALEQVITTLTNKSNVQVLLFLYLFSGLLQLIKNSGGIKAVSNISDKHVDSKKGVFFTLWALLPVTFIDCGFRVVGAGYITRTLAEKHKIAKERFAFMLNNTASPVIELIPIATTFVGFNIANIAVGLKAAGISEHTSAYGILLKAIPFEFFSIVAIIVTFISVFFEYKHSAKPHSPPTGKPKDSMKMDMGMSKDNAILKPRLINLVLPMLCIVSLSIFFFWFFGRDNSNSSFVAAITNTDPNKAMLVSLFISIIISAIIYRFQKYSMKLMTTDLLAGANEMMSTLVILILAWSLASVTHDLGLSEFIQQYAGKSLATWSVPLTLFLLSAVITYFIGSGWGTASLMMPFAIPLAVSGDLNISLCVAAVITGGTFGDVSSPVAGMTNMASNVAHADHAKYLKYANPYNFLSAGIAAVLFLLAGIFYGGA